MLPFEDQVQRIYDFYVRKKRTFDIVSDSESENEGNAVPSLTKRVPKRQKRGKHSKKNAEKPNIAAGKNLLDALFKLYLLPSFVSFHLLQALFIFANSLFFL